MIFHKPLESITEQDIQALIDSQLDAQKAERKTVEYKQALPGGTDDDKKEFLADVSSFANAAGGNLLFGIEEQAGIPTKLTGIQLDDVDAQKLRLENMLRDGIAPRLPRADVHPAALASKPGHYVLILRVQQSLLSPHRVIFKDHGHFYSRNSAGKYRLDVTELRTAFELSGAMAERIRNFRADRLSKIVAEETPLLLNRHAPKLVLHIVPFQAFNPVVQVDIVSLLQHRSLIEPVMLSESSQYGADTRYNFDGLVSWYPQTTYVQFFRNGSVEAVDTSILGASKEAKVFSGPLYERRLREALKRYVTAQRELDVDPPLFVMVSLLGVQGYRLKFDSAAITWDDYRIDRPDLIVSETIIEDFNYDITKVTSPIFNTIANAAGWKYSMVSYDEDGQSSIRSE